MRPQEWPTSSEGTRLIIHDRTSPYTVLLIPDTHVPEHHTGAVANIAALIGEIEPAGVVHTGDFLNLDAPSRWSKGTINEFAGNVHQEREQGKRVLDLWFSDYYGYKGLHVGNHDRRISDYLRKYAPAVADMPEWEYGRLLDLDSFGAEVRDSIHPLAPGWVSTHGDNREIKLSPDAGKTAYNAAVKYDVNVVCGHTHRAGIVQTSHGYNGRMKAKIGMEIGHVTDMRKVSYLGTGYANWQMALGLVHVNGRKVQPQLILVSPDGSFTYDGMEFRNGKIRKAAK
ncbi:metallophosphoesterase [Streptomyces smyrnaeus]|uniref:metallophosphoesterase n=1 Tax=Streptomyces smyrnaeus TaxID=1387713 RepID=UPI0036CBBF2C